MHVVFVTNKLVNGGGERVLLKLLSGVREAGGRASILFLGKRNAIVSGVRAEMEKAGAQVVQLTSPFKAFRLLRDASVLHLYNVNAYVKALPVLPIVRRIPVICHVHGVAESANPLARLLFCSQWNPCDDIIFVSEAGRASWGISRGQVISNPVTFPTQRKRLTLVPTQHVRFISVNRLVAVKQVSVQLDIIAELRDRHGLDASLDIVGDGLEKDALVSHAHRLGLRDAVSFLGDLPHNKVLELYQNYDGFISTSAAEGLGLGLIEALGAGLTAFVAPIPAYREVANVGGGVVFIDPLSPASAAKTIATSYSNSQLARANRDALFETFDASAFVARMMKFYR